MSNYHGHFNTGSNDGESYRPNYGISGQQLASSGSEGQPPASVNNSNYPHQMMSNSGSITQFHSPTSSHLPLNMGPNANQRSGMGAIQQQPTPQIMTQQPPIFNQQYAGSAQQQISMQQPTVPQQGVQPSLMNEQKQNQMHQYSQYSQDTAPHQTNSSETRGSYAARSVQAYATVGSPTPAASFNPPTSLTPSPMSPQVQAKGNKFDESPAVQAQQNRILTDCTRNVQENAYYMKQAMDKGELATVLDRASQMVGELCDTSSGSLTPKNYYELYMRALDDMPNLEDYFLSLAGNESVPYTMKNIYEHVQYCPRVLSRLYLQISAGSALIRSKEETAQWVLNDLVEAVKCVQNPLRGLFLRHFLLQATRDKLPDGDIVQHAYEFVLANFIEMNKLWVRIQHLPGDGKTKEQRKRRERERNELRILVGTNLVRLSQLEGVSSKIYGEVILPKILEQITVCGDPLAQAYLIDCIIQVFPDEYHIETLPILLAVCPKLRDKVNTRTIMQSLMDRLSNYYAEEELLDEKDTNEVKKSVAQESFPLFEECVQKVYHARGPKLVSKEVIRLQTALLNFSLKCFPGNMDQVSNCLGVCIEFIRQAANATGVAISSTPPSDDAIKLDGASVTELQKMLSVPLESLSLKVLQLNNYSELLKFLPWDSRHDVGMTMLRAIDNLGDAPIDLKELTELFNILQPVIQGQEYEGIPSESSVEKKQEENNLVSKLIYLLESNDLCKAFEMLSVARSYLRKASSTRLQSTLVPVVFAALRIAKKLNSESEDTEKDKNTQAVSSEAEVVNDDSGANDGGTNIDSVSSVEVEPEKKKTETKSEIGSSLSIREVFLFVQSTIALLSSGSPELGIKLYLSASLSSDHMVDSADGNPNDFLKQVTNEFLTAAFGLYDDEVVDSQTRQRCITNIVGTLLAIKSLPSGQYEQSTTKVTQYAAKLMKKQEQCRMVLLCSHLFYAVDKGNNAYQNPQRSLECLQRSLKLADASAMSTPSNFSLFIDLLEQYVYFFEKNNPVITEAYVTGLIALIEEHLGSLKGVDGRDPNVALDGKAHFHETLEYIKRKMNAEETAGRFAQIKIE